MRTLEKRAFVIRLGAIGDIVLVTPVLAALKREGYHVTLLCKPHAPWLLKHAGLVDVYVFADRAFEDEITRRIAGDEGARVATAQVYAHELAAGYDRVVDLVGIVEGKLMVKVWEFSEEFAKKSEEIEKHAGHGVAFVPPDVNHVDALLDAAGFESAAMPVEYKRPVWRVSHDERHWARKKLRRWGVTDHDFLVVYQLTGSGIAKTWPFAEQFCGGLKRRAPETKIILLGIGDDEALTWGWSERMPWVIPFAADRCPAQAQRDDSGRTVDYTYIRNPMTFRQDGALVGEAACYVGPDTSFLHVAGALSVPCVPLLTVTSHRHISLYYSGARPIQSPVACSPCGKLVTDCHRGERTGAARCMEAIQPQIVVNETMEVYEQWRTKRSRKSA